ITVTLRDVNNNPVSGKSVTLAKSGGSSTITTVSGTTNASGQAIFAVRNTVVEATTYTATDITDSVIVTQTATVSFTAGALSRIQISPATATITAGGSLTFTATGYDAAGNSIGDVTGSTTFTISPNGSCSGAVCTATVAGEHT